MRARTVVQKCLCVVAISLFVVVCSANVYARERRHHAAPAYHSRHSEWKCPPPPRYHHNHWGHRGYHHWGWRPYRPWFYGYGYTVFAPRTRVIVTPPPVYYEPVVRPSGYYYQSTSYSTPYSTEYVVVPDGEVVTETRMVVNR